MDEQQLISSIMLHGTSTPLENGQKNYDVKIDIPFLDFLNIAIIVVIAFLVFKLTLIDIWKD